jgi:6-phosphogluconolactonase
MKTEIFPQAGDVASAAAAYLAQQITATLATKSTFSMAISGGRTPWEMLRHLAQAQLPWERVHLFQVDERIAPEGHADRNLTQLQQAIAGTEMAARMHTYPMPVNEVNLAQAAQHYTDTLFEVTGDGCLDLIHLGLGTDGHTASLIPGDPVCEEQLLDITCTLLPYQERLRMTMTYPLLNRAKRLLWIVTGSEKGDMLQQLLQQNHGIPGGKVSQAAALLFVDQAALGSKNN